MTKLLSFDDIPDGTTVLHTQGGISVYGVLYTIENRYVIRICHIDLLDSLKPSMQYIYNAEWWWLDHSDIERTSIVE